MIPVRVALQAPAPVGVGLPRRAAAAGGAQPRAERQHAERRRPGGATAPPPSLGRKALGLGCSTLSGEAFPFRRSAVAAHGEAVSLRHGLLSVRLSTSRSARVAFCGDFVRTEGEGGAARAGSVEGAALSGLRLAEQLQLVI